MPEKTPPTLIATRRLTPHEGRIALWIHGQKPTFWKGTNRWTSQNNDPRRAIIPATLLNLEPGESMEVEIAKAGTTESFMRARKMIETLETQKTQIRSRYTEDVATLAALREKIDRTKAMYKKEREVSELRYATAIQLRARIEELEKE